MLLLAIHELLSRRTATLLAGAGLLTATLGFVVLAGTSQTTQAVLTHDIANAWPSPYDILVRPVGAQDPIEANLNLVRPNYLTGLRGGISEAQLDQIRAIPGIAVAAPIAVVGYTYWPDYRTFDLGPYLTKDKISFLRLSVTSTGDNGKSIYPSETVYIAASASGETVFDWARSQTIPGTQTILVQTNLVTSSGVYKCTMPEVCVAPIHCVGPQSAPETQCSPLNASQPGWVGVYDNYPVPILVAGVDPVAEASLVGLDRCVKQGRYLDPTDAPAVTVVLQQPATGIPVLTSNQSFIREAVDSRLDESSTRSLPPGSISTVADWAPVSDNRTTADDLYRSFLPTVSSSYSTGPLWEIGAVKYTQAGSDSHLRVSAAPADPAVLQFFSLPQFRLVPEISDVWLRPVSEHPQPVPLGYAPGYHWTWKSVGTYDPTCLPGFSTPTGRMDAYNVPEVLGPDGQGIFPNRSLASYTNIPPLVLTTLAGARYFANPNVDTGAPGEAFISAIRIRVVGTESPSSSAEARLARVAAEIQQATHLQVDIVRGSSPRPMMIDLPAGKFGRPAMTVSELWSAKGVAFTFLRAVSAQNLALFGLVLVGGMILVGETGYISAVRRRREFGVLRALGWRTSSIALLVELEMLVLGLITGLLALAFGIPLQLRLGLGTSAWQIAAVVPLAVVVAAVAGIVPSFAAARGSVVAIMQSTGTALIGQRPVANSLFGIAWRELRGQWRVEAILGALAIALGAGTLGVLVVIATAFNGQLDTTLLGVDLAGRVRPFHILLATLTLVIGSIAAAEVVTLSYLERRSGLGALRALGWPPSAVAQFLIAQSTVLGLGGATLASVVVVVTGFLLHAPFLAIGWGVLATAGMSVLATAIAVLAPLAHAYRANPADALRGE
jgi:putative ABC transport system permease protein